MEEIEILYKKLSATEIRSADERLKFIFSNDVSHPSKAKKRRLIILEDDKPFNTTYVISADNTEKSKWVLRFNWVRSFQIHFDQIDDIEYQLSNLITH